MLTKLPRWLCAAASTAAAADTTRVCDISAWMVDVASEAHAASVASAGALGVRWQGGKRAHEPGLGFTVIGLGTVVASVQLQVLLRWRRRRRHPRRRVPPGRIVVGGPLRPTRVRRDGASWGKGEPGDLRSHDQGALCAEVERQAVDNCAGEPGPRCRSVETGAAEGQWTLQTSPARQEAGAPCVCPTANEQWWQSDLQSV